PAASKSYLVGKKIIATAISTGAQAIHPGYGFLSENVEFLREVEKAGLIFIGPGEKAIAAMGDKITSKELAKAAGVTTVPGHIGLIADADDAVKIATKVGYPVMIKASAGGGGKGMRVAYNNDEAREGFQSSKNEAKSSFDDDRIFIEKYIEEPRHIEIQILGDEFGSIIHLGERECSIQRRHQKVIEEAPSPFIDEKMRKAMGEEALALSRAVQYKSAGTVEFIVDKDKNFYFLEMNTRLQVEHPVTEKITGLDLVEQMLLVAAGEKLTLAQEDVQLKGWAIEARVYAEDPFRGFLPSIGRLTRYTPPEENENVRVDTGVFEGSEISIYYDPMIAKLVTYRETREQAIDEMRQALDAYYIRGIAHNIPFLSAVMAHERFRCGNISTNFIAEEYPDGFQGGNISDALAVVFVGCATFLNAVERSRKSTISGQITNTPPPLRKDWVVAVNDKLLPVIIAQSAQGAQVFVDGENIQIVSDWVPGDPVFKGVINNIQMNIEIDLLEMGYKLTTDGVSCVIKVMPPHIAQFLGHMKEKIALDTSNFLLCPMPGLIVSLEVKEGDEIKLGQTLAVVEAMKMENILKAERDGTVSKLCAKVGDSLAVDQVIMEFK
ncbi:MAG: ATP-binding protein, partial [Sphingomonadales bacterium]